MSLHWVGTPTLCNLDIDIHKYDNFQEYLNNKRKVENTQIDKLQEQVLVIDLDEVNVKPYKVFNKINSEHIASIIFLSTKIPKIKTSEIFHFIKKDICNYNSLIIDLYYNIINGQNENNFPFSEDEDERLDKLENIKVEEMSTFLNKKSKELRQCTKADSAFISFIYKNYQRIYTTDYTLGYIDRDKTICTFTILQDDFLEINDIRTESQLTPALDFLKTMNIVSYLGLPIKYDNTKIGSICITNEKERKFTEDEKRRIKFIRQEVLDEINQVKNGK